jgi:hypothetical protein
MIETLIVLLIELLVLALFGYIMYLILIQLLDLWSPAPNPARKIVLSIFWLVALLIAIAVFAGAIPLPYGHAVKLP